LAVFGNYIFYFMKNTIFYTSLAVGILLGNTSLAGPGGTGTGAAAPAVTVTPRTGIRPVTPNTSPAQPGMIQQNSPGQTSFTTSNQVSFTTNGLTGTNGLPNTNNFAGTNGLTGIGTNNVTASVNLASNVSPTFTTNFNGNVVVRDQAVTPSDRVLLTTLSQGVQATLGITPNGNMPVHFLINNGTVTVMGTVQSSAQSQSVVSQVQQTPGVLSVINDMHVASPLAPATTLNNQSGLLGTPTDRAFSPRDQTLLTTVQQEAAMQLGVTSLSQMPVHFSIENGVVGVTGQVSSPQEKQALIAAISRTHGIVRVVDNVGVIPNSTTGVLTPGSGTAVTPSVNNGSLSPTGSGTNTIFLNTTNSSGF
jgi:BON domain